MRPILALILSLVLTVPAFALSGATADGEDRFPYVVEIKFEQRLVCSGTVLFPRIVVTAAHCLQHKARWPGGLVYIDEYAQAAELTVAVTRGDKTETYDVAEVTISPAWRSEISASNTVTGSNRNQRFAHDIALVVTKEPIEVGLPPSLFKLAAGDGLVPEDISCASKSAMDQSGDARARHDIARHAGETPWSSRRSRRVRGRELHAAFLRRGWRPPLSKHHAQGERRVLREPWQQVEPADAFR